MIDNPRLRLLVGNHGRTLVVLLGVVGLCSFAAAGAIYLNPPTETVTYDTHEQGVTTTATTSAVVESEDSLWPAGTELADKPVYLLNASPRLTVTGETTVEGADSAVVDHEWRLTINATRDGEEFWSENETIAAETHEGTETRTTATVDVRALRDRVAAVQEQIGTAGTVSVYLTLLVEYETDPGAEYGYEGVETLTVAVYISEDSYVVDGNFQQRASHSVEETGVVTQPRNWGGIGGLVLVGLVSMFALAGVVAQRPGSVDLGKARNDLHRRQYAQWISTGIIPMGIKQQFIELESLEDVVDVAIDTEERVVYDRRRDLYAVISENVVYYFSPGGSWMATAFPGMDMPEEPPSGPGEPPAGAQEPPSGPSPGGQAGDGTGPTEQPSSDGQAGGFEDAFREDAFEDDADREDR